MISSDPAAIEEGVSADAVVQVTPGESQIIADMTRIAELLAQLDGPLAAMQPLPCQEIAKQLKTNQCFGQWCGEILTLVSLIEQYRFAEAGQVATKLRERMGQEMPSSQECGVVTEPIIIFKGDHQGFFNEMRELRLILSQTNREEGDINE